MSSDAVPPADAVVIGVDYGNDVMHRLRRIRAEARQR